MKREVKIGITGITALVLLFFGMNFLKGITIKSKAKYDKTTIIIVIMTAKVQKTLNVGH